MDKDDVPRCRIPQEEIKDPRFIAMAYSPIVIAEAIKFKHKAYLGSVHLSHHVLAADIQLQIGILSQALEIEKCL